MDGETEIEGGCKDQHIDIKHFFNLLLYHWTDHHTYRRRTRRRPVPSGIHC